MELTRRATVAMVLTGGLGTSAGVRVLSRTTADPGTVSELADPELRTVESVAEIIYPSGLSTQTALIEGYLSSQSSDRLRAIRDASRALDTYAKGRYRAPFATLTTAEGETLLREMGVDRAAPDPDGTVSERVRYYLVNGLLYALFTNPAGSRLFGIDNPRGYPGGYESYTEPLSR